MRMDLAANDPLISTVLVTPDFFSASDPYDVIGQVGDFIRRVTDDGRFTLDDLPPVAVMSAHVASFEGEVCNGGLS